MTTIKKTLPNGDMVTYHTDGTITLVESDVSRQNKLTVGFNDARTVSNDVTGIDSTNFIIRRHTDGFGKDIATLFIAPKKDKDEMVRYLKSSLTDGTVTNVEVYDHLDGLKAWDRYSSNGAYVARIFLTGYYGQNKNVYRNAIRSSREFLEAQRALHKSNVPNNSPLKMFISDWKETVLSDIKKEKESVEKTSIEAITTCAVETFIERFFASDRPFIIMTLVKDYLTEHYDESVIRNADEFDSTDTLSDYTVIKHRGSYGTHEGDMLYQDIVSTLHEDDLLSDYMTDFDDEVILFEHLVLGYIEGCEISRLVELVETFDESPNDRKIYREDVIAYARDYDILAHRITVQRVGTVESLLSIIQADESDELGDAYAIRHHETDVAFLRIANDEIVALQKVNGRLVPIETLETTDDARIISIVQQITGGEA